MDSSADKEGLQSSGRKEQSSRHGNEPTPAMSPVPGAFGRESIGGEEAEGKPVVPSQHDIDELDESELGLDDDDLELDDEDLTEDEAERADGA
jgi:hypothetical protein